jgi:hypothetical protein
MTFERLPSGFPLYTSIHEAWPLLRQTQGAHGYTVRLFELFVKDTPFKQQDISELHEAIQEVHNTRYTDATIRRRMYDLRKDGSIVLLDGEFSRAQDRVFQWTKTPAPKKTETLPTRSVFGTENAGSRGQDPASHFFSRLLSQVFS